MECPCTDYQLGNMTVEVLDTGKVSFVDDSGTYRTIAEARQKALDMLTLLGDERVKAAIAADKEAPQC
jgi:hypothetical protein